MKNLKFYHLTDLHYYANEEIGSSGEAFRKKCELDQKCMAESGAIIDSAFRSISEDKDTDIVLISGDLTFDGEKQSHDCLVKKFEKLQNAGKKVFITFATHDFHMDARKYTDEDGVTELPKYTREELRKLYDNFGFNQAIAEHKDSYSYCVQLNDEVRLLALNDDGNATDFCGYYDDLIVWIKNQVDDAHKNGFEIIAMTHHPVIDPSPIYPVFFHQNMLGGYEITTPMLADMGIRYMFVGHTHIHDIDYLDTLKGNRIYQINTAALTAYPLAYRKIEYSDNGMDIKTLQVTDIDFELGGRAVLDYAKEHFTYMIRSIFDSLENDYGKFIELSKGFSGDEQKLLKLKPVLEKIGSYVNRLTFYNFCRIFGCGSYVDESIKDKKIIDFICQVILNLYSGKENYSPDTPEYKAFIAVCRRLGKVIKLKDYLGKRISLEKLIGEVMYDDGIDDWNAVVQ